LDKRKGVQKYVPAVRQGVVGPSGSGRNAKVGGNDEIVFERDSDDD